MNYCAVHHVVQGALALHSQDPRLGKVVQLSHSNLNVRNEHVKILLKLLSLGVDLWGFWRALNTILLGAWVDF